MPAPRELQENDSMHKQWEGSAYTYAALVAHPLTRLKAEPWRLLLDEIDERSKQQRVCWLEEMSAQATCDQVNYRLDLLTEEFQSAKVGELRAKNKHWKEKEARASAEFTLYFGSLRPFEFIRLALESQLPLMESWPQKLSQEASPELQGYASKMKEILDEGKQALKAREEARAKTALHRVRDIHGLIGRLNQQRLATYTELLQLAQQLGEAKSWPEAFFAKASAPQPNKEEARIKSAAVLSILAARKLVLSDEEKQKITTTTDLERLEHWISAAATVSQAAEVFSSSSA
jgi:hypothetical protein